MRPEIQKYEATPMAAPPTPIAPKDQAVSPLERGLRTGDGRAPIAPTSCKGSSPSPDEGAENTTDRRRCCSPDRMSRVSSAGGPSVRVNRKTCAPGSTRSSLPSRCPATGWLSTVTRSVDDVGPLGVEGPDHHGRHDAVDLRQPPRAIGTDEGRTLGLQADKELLTCARELAVETKSLGLLGRADAHVEPFRARRGGIPCDRKRERDDRSSRGERTSHRERQCTRDEVTAQRRGSSRSAAPLLLSAPERSRCSPRSRPHRIAV